VITFTCAECNRSFNATSKGEAEDAYNKHVKEDRTAAHTFKDALDTGEVAYARFCPYCGSVAIEGQ